MIIQTRENPEYDCQCRYCVEERKKGKAGMPVQPGPSYITPCELRDSVREKVLGTDPPGWSPEASSNPNDWDYSKRHPKR
jgi:hypothetical protein